MEQEQLKKIRKTLAEQHDNLIDQYNELIDKLKAKSTVKNRIQRIEEKASIEIELEKLSNRIELLLRIVKAYDTKISLANYNIITPSTDLSISKVEENNRELLQLLEKEYEKLDILSTKKTLSSEFRRIRLKGLNKYDFGPFPFSVGLLSAIVIGTIIPKIVNMPFSVSNLLLTLSIPFVIGTGITTYAIVKGTNQKKEAFNNLNNQLGEEKLEDDISLDYDTYKESTKINQMIDSKIHELMIILINQKENEMILEISTKGREELEKNNEHLRNFNVDKDIETIEYGTTTITNSGRFPEYEEPQARYTYSNPANYKSTRTEMDETEITDVLHEDLIDEISQEQSETVLTRKRTRSNNGQGK